MSIEDFKRNRQKELTVLEIESQAGERLLTGIQSYLRDLQVASPKEKETQIFQKYRNSLRELAANLFDDWSSIDDKISMLKERLHRLNNFRDH